MNLLKNLLKTFNGPWSKVHRQSSHGLWSMVYGLIILSSCATPKQLIYLQGVDEGKSDNFYPGNIPEYRLQKQDILYVSILTGNEDINSVLNLGSSTQGNQNLILSESGAYLSGYAINDSGYIRIPLIGHVKVLDKTMEDAKLEIENMTSKFLVDAAVTVKLLSYKFTVLGEVKGPGTYRNYNNQLTIFDALGMAGDITSMGDRSKLLVLRSINGGTHALRVNLLKKDILTSEGYYLLPNDIVIVEPLNIKFLQINSPTISFFVSTLVSSISLSILILTLL